MIKKVLKVGAIVLVLGVASGCASQSALDAAQATADAAARDAAAAKSAAEAARAAADSAAQSAASATEHRRSGSVSRDRSSGLLRCQSRPPGADVPAVTGQIRKNLLNALFRRRACRGVFYFAPRDGGHAVCRLSSKASATLSQSSAPGRSFVAATNCAVSAVSASRGGGGSSGDPPSG